MEKLEFKGTKDEWKSVYIPKTKYHSDRYEVQYGKDGECIAEFVHNEYDSKLIASAPDLLEALQETNIDLNILKTNFIQIEKVDSRAEGMIETIQKWIDRNNKSIEKALK